MNTNRRGKKRNDIVDKVAKTWNKRLDGLIKARGYSQKTFAQAYKEKYGIGNQADVSRWVNVGNEAAKGERIGFPSYDTMKRIADFFDVTVGYITGETDYETFEMERACALLGIDEATGVAIERITKLTGATRLEKYEKANYGKALCRFLTVESLEPFIGGICELAEAMYILNNPVDYFKSEKVMSIRPEVMELALKYKDVHFEEEIDNPAEITDEVIEAIHIISEAEDNGYAQELRLEYNVKVAKYELQERYMKLLEEISSEENLTAIRAHYYEIFSSADELKKQFSRKTVE